MKPSIGKIVHYCHRMTVDRDGGDPDIKAGEHLLYPAMIVKLKPALEYRDENKDPKSSLSASVDLQVFGTSCDSSRAIGFIERNVPFSPNYKPGHWTWPPKEKAWSANRSPRAESL